jgi:hypothetical protein
MRRFAALCGLTASTLLAQKLPFTAGAMMKLARISEHRLSPDGKLVAFTVQRIDIEANKKSRQRWPSFRLEAGPLKFGSWMPTATIRSQSP